MLDSTRLLLSDGTGLDELIDRQMHEVSLRVMSDPDLYRHEMERIFARTWLLLGHESEIPKSGDFVLRNMGEDNVIVARDVAGHVHVSLNVCPHRGMRVCTAETGNTQVHRCIYHGWAFRSDGRFVGAPIEREQMHGSMRGKDELGLRKARVHLYGGLIFATWNIDGPSFLDFMGEAKPYFDLLFCRTDLGLEMLGPPQRFIVPCNWKLPSEQSALDVYHALTLHRSLMEGGVMGGTAETIYDMAPGMYGVDISANGHSLRFMDATQTFKTHADLRLDEASVEERLRLLPPPGVTSDLIPQLFRHLSSDQVEILAKHPPQVGGMFPNVMVLFIFAPREDGGTSGALALHSYVPRGPNEMEFVNFIFAEKGAPDHVKRDMRQNAIRQSGTSGMIEQDDADAWPYIMRNCHGTVGKSMTLKYQAITGEQKPDGWPLGGSVYSGFSKDDTQWNWWLKYNELMSAH